MISAQEIEQRRTADQLKRFVEEVRDRVESDKSERRIARRGSGLYRMFIDEIIPLSQFAHLIYPSDTLFQPVIGNQGFDVEVSDSMGKLIDRVEIAKPHDGYAEARDIRLTEERGVGQIRVLDLGGQLDELTPWIAKTANDKSLKDYGDCTLVLVAATLPPYEQELRDLEARALELVGNLNGMVFKAKRAFLAVPTLDKCYAIGGSTRQQRCAPSAPITTGVMDKGVFMKTYKLLAADGSTVVSETPGALGGNSKAGIYGRLDCSAANSALSKGYAQHRVFFANEQDAIQAGYRPCGRCMRAEYKEWKSGPEGNGSYPWKQLPK